MKVLFTTVYGEEIKGIVQYRDMVVVATTRRVLAFENLGDPEAFRISIIAKTEETTDEQKG